MSQIVKVMDMENPKQIPLTQLHPHPRNPRFAPREDVVTQIASQLDVSKAFDQAHALIVRPRTGDYEIIAGHHRALAAKQAGLDAVPCWVRTMTDEEAYMALVLDNTQSELLPLEEGMHALQSGLSGSEYARRTGKPQRTMAERMAAARVAHYVSGYPLTGLSEYWQALNAIHAAPEWLWAALVDRLLTEDWTVDATRKQVKPLQALDRPPTWSDASAIAAAVIEGTLKPTDVARFTSIFKASSSRIHQAREDVERFLGMLDERLASARPAKLSEVTTVCESVEQEQADLDKERREAENFRLRRAEQIAARTARLRSQVSLEEWLTLAPEEQEALLHLSPHDVAAIHFIKQKSTAIEWAWFSWNPVTGCLHNCPYCYARDDALSARLAKFYPYGFAPTFRPATLLAPRHMKVPKEAAQDARFQNVFTCSMADLFGGWVPSPWIEAVFREMRLAPQWNFLCLTKFPKRYNEFEIPANAWLGTTVDLQARVKAAEDAFAHIKTGIRWLSVEPLLEPLRFQHLDRFDWIVIGGASKQNETPEWHPPFAWVYDLVRQADDAGCKVYFKDNLLKKRRLQLPFDAPLPDETAPAPAVFQYLNAPKKG